jgi:hypothetical protein
VVPYSFMYRIEAVFIESKIVDPDRISDLGLYTLVHFFNF